MAEVRDLITMAIERFGSEEKLGKAVGVSQNAIWAAKRAGRVSAELAKKIDEATDGEVPKWKLRPDLWNDPATEPAENAA